MGDVRVWPYDPVKDGITYIIAKRDLLGNLR